MVSLELHIPQRRVAHGYGLEGPMSRRQRIDPELIYIGLSYTTAVLLHRMPVLADCHCDDSHSSKSPHPYRLLFFSIYICRHREE